MGVELALPEQLKTEPPALLQQARALTVSSGDQYTEAAMFLKRIKGASKSITDFFRPLKQSAEDHKKQLLAAERTLTDPLTTAETLTKRAMLVYDEAERKRAQEEQRRLQAEADERARREREALERKAELAKKPETQQRYQEAAACVCAAPVIHVEAPVPRIAGISTRTIWKAKVTDPLKVPREFLMVDEKKLDQYARAMKEGASVPGVEFYAEQSLASSRS
jgi:hypothetical protein